MKAPLFFIFLVVIMSALAVLVYLHPDDDHRAPRLGNFAELGVGAKARPQLG